MLNRSRALSECCFKPKMFVLLLVVLIILEKYLFSLLVYFDAEVHSM